MDKWYIRSYPSVSDMRRNGLEWISGSAKIKVLEYRLYIDNG
jgi:hypothetical protein